VDDDRPFFRPSTLRDSASNRSTTFVGSDGSASATISSPSRFVSISFSTCSV
jgi:hypothetical protein